MNHILKYCALWLLLCGGHALSGQSLETEFLAPPPEARPKTWLHVMSGNMSREGLTKDLEALSRVGIGGVLLFNVTQGIPVGKVKFNSDEHTALMAHAAAECERLGLTFGLHNCDGWSSSGGPWNTPENSMKQVTWADTVVAGGRVELELPAPPVEQGFYRDIATLAWPALPAEAEHQANRPVVTASPGVTELAAAVDGSPESAALLPGADSAGAWLQFAYPRPITPRSAYLLQDDRASFVLLASDDGTVFRDTVPLRLRTTGKQEYAVGEEFAPVTGRYFRLLTHQNARVRDAKLGTVQLFADRLDRTSISRTAAGSFGPIGEPGAGTVVERDKVIDLSDRVADGRLAAELPPGEWTIARFGYTSTGAVNIPASAEGRGLEADKFDPKAFKIHYDAYVGKVVRAGKAAAPNALKYVEIDSYEVGGQNWTHGLQDTFRAEYGYDLIPFLPLFAGRFVDDARTTEDVLYDLRGLYARLLNDNYYGYYTELCHRDGLESYIEPYGGGPLNNLDAGGRADIPMGEFWLQRPTSRVGDAVSAAHIYGKPVVAAEGFTAFETDLNWAFHPAMAKADGDRNWASGINEFVFHRFAHQANTHVAPGMTMNRWGAHFDRTQTWWETAGAAYFRYLTRGQVLLRHGKPVADLLVFVGNGAPNGHLYRDEFSPTLPNYLNYDCVNEEVLLAETTGAQDGHLTLSGGNSYAALALRNTDRMTLRTLRKLDQLSASGLPITGLPPREVAGFAAEASATVTFDSLVSIIWARPNVHRELGWDELLATANLVPDLRGAEDDLLYVHRSGAGEEVYFVYNAGAATDTLSFRNVSGFPERWYPNEGRTEPIRGFERVGEATRVALEIEPEGSAFIVFRNGQPPPMEPVMTAAGEQSVDGQWTVRFDPQGGYGGQWTTDTLTDWKDHPLDSVRHFAGTATYTTQVSIVAEQLVEGRRLTLDLGAVSIAAVVSVNGTPIDTLWKAPFTVDVTDHLRAGENELSVAVTNQWTNRLIGEARLPEHFDGYALERYRNGNEVTRKMPDWYTDNRPPPAGPRTTFSTATFYNEDDPLLSSGLLGPVRLLALRPEGPAPASPPKSVGHDGEGGGR